MNESEKKPSNIEDVKNKLKEYHNKYRHKELPMLDLSEPYDLFPEDSVKTSGAKDGWGWYTEKADKWPNGDLPGVYCIFDNEHRLLYIGKASNNSNIGARLQAYFKYGKNRECEVIQEWTKGSPKYIATIGFSDEEGFQASSLEEYLIKELEPKENKVGK